MKLRIGWFILTGVLLFLLIKECTTPPEIKTVVEYETKTDTIVKTQIIPGGIRYVRRTITEQGKDSIIYVEKPSENDTITLTAREFRTTLEADSARADLNILSTGEVLDVTGTISYTQKNTTTTIYKDKPKLYLYGGTSVKPVFETIELGLDLATKKYIFGIKAEHNLQFNQTYIGVKVGIKIL